MPNLDEVKNFKKIKNFHNFFFLTFTFEVIEVKDTIRECDNHKSIGSDR